jgi:hypothetical protein
MKLLMIAIKQVLSYLEIVTTPHSLPTLQKGTTPARKTLPSLAITDPRFVYKSAACTDIKQTFEREKNERLQRLLNDADGDRAKDKSIVREMPRQKLQRVHR